MFSAKAWFRAQIAPYLKAIRASMLNVSGAQYRGVWDASTNTPALQNGTGENGSFYVVGKAGEHDFGAGTGLVFNEQTFTIFGAGEVVSGSVQTFAIGDIVVYDTASNAWNRVATGTAMQGPPGPACGISNTVPGHKIADVTLEGAVIATINETETVLDSVSMNSGALEVTLTNESGSPSTKSVNLLSQDANNALISGSDGKLFMAATVLWNDDQVLSGDNTTNTTVTLTPTVVPDPTNPAVSQTNYTVKAEAKIDGVSIKENAEKQLFAVDQKFDVIGSVQPTPADTGNTTNLNSIFKDASKVTWAIDKNGKAIMLCRPKTVTLSATGSANFPSSPQEGDEYIETAGGTDTGAVTGRWLFNGVAWVYLATTSALPTTSTITPVVYNGSAFVSAQANLDTNCADLITLADGSRIHTGKVTITGTLFSAADVGKWFYTSQTTAGGITSTKPTSGLVQQLFFVESTSTIHVDIEEAFTA